MAENLSDRRQAEKQASRASDEEALAKGASVQQIEAKNAFLLADRTIVHWDRSKHL